MAGATKSIPFTQSNELIKPSNLWQMKPHDEALVHLADRMGSLLACLICSALLYFRPDYFIPGLDQPISLYREVKLMVRSL